MPSLIAIATCAEHPCGYDEESLEEALDRLGQPYEWAVWNDPTVDWSRFGVVALRSTWDYTEQLDAFLDWIVRVDAVATVVNPAPVVRWNAHKRYLLDLEARGIRIVPTELVAGRESVDVRAVVDRRGWPGGIVVKPSVSAGAKDLSHWHGDADGLAGAQAALDVLLGDGQDVLVQPLLDSIISEGEVSIMFIGAEPTHAVCKVPAAGDIRSQPHLGGAVTPVAPTDEHLAIGRAAIAAAAACCSVRVEDLVVARVDVVGSDGHLQLMELEMIEPYLFAPFAPAAGEKLAAALSTIARRP